MELGWVERDTSPIPGPRFRSDYNLARNLISESCFSLPKSMKETLQPDSATVNHSENFSFLHRKPESHAQFKISSVCFPLGISWA